MKSLIRINFHNKILALILIKKNLNFDFFFLLFIYIYIISYRKPKIEDFFLYNLLKKIFN